MHTMLLPVLMCFLPTMMMLMMMMMMMMMMMIMTTIMMQMQSSQFERYAISKTCAMFHPGTCRYSNLFSPRHVKALTQHLGFLSHGRIPSCHGHPPGAGGDPLTQHQMLQQKALRDRAKVRTPRSALRGVFFVFGRVTDEKYIIHIIYIYIYMYVHSIFVYHDFLQYQQISTNTL